MNVEVSVESLRAGLKVWRAKRWEVDFGDDIYASQAKLLAEGVTEHWWRETVPILARWLALRPLSKADALERGRPHLSKLNDAYEGLRNAPEFGAASWNALEGMFEVAWAIKGVNSPVFASKLCHFMRPDLYVVIDGEAVGLQAPYPMYWKACSEAWRQAEDLHATLREVLLAEAAGGVSPVFPFATKITELCVIGARFPAAPPQPLSPS